MGSGLGTLSAALRGHGGPLREQHSEFDLKNLETVWVGMVKEGPGGGEAWRPGSTSFNSTLPGPKAEILMICEQKHSGIRVVHKCSTGHLTDPPRNFLEGG